MGALSDELIEHYCHPDRLRPMISPFSAKSVTKGSADQRLISFGNSSYGYDARLDTKFKVFSDTHCAVMDPKEVDARAFVDIETDVLTIPPRGYVLGHTLEVFDIPRDVVVICLGKSTYARTGLIVNVTPLEPEWRGQVTLEFFNALPIPTKVYAGEGICQFVFLRGERPCRTSYADKKGKYQDQRGVVLAKT